MTPTNPADRRQPRPRRLVVLGVTIMAVAVVMALIALWWWALRGMSTDVGTASTFTFFAAFLTGLIIAGYGAGAL